MVTLIPCPGTRCIVPEHGTIHIFFSGNSSLFSFYDSLPTPIWYSIFNLFSFVRYFINSLRYTDATTVMPESDEELKSLLLRVKEESGKAALKLNIQKTKIMASGPITSWQTQGEKMEAVTAFLFLGSKITKDGDCSNEIKRHMHLGRKAMKNLDSILKVKAMVFSVVMNRCENWMIKKAEC